MRANCFRTASRLTAILAAGAVLAGCIDEESIGLRSSSSNAPPTVSVLVPTQNGTYTTQKATIELAGTAEDDDGVSEVRWRSNRGGDGVASGRETWRVMSVPLTEGENLITIIAKDTNGSTSRETVVVHYETTETPGSEVDGGSEYGESDSGSGGRTGGTSSGSGSFDSDDSGSGDSGSGDSGSGDSGSGDSDSSGSGDSDSGDSDSGDSDSGSSDSGSSDSGSSDSGSSDSGSSDSGSSDSGSSSDGTRSVTLTWQQPTEKEDGTYLSDLAGVRIYYGQASGQYTGEYDHVLDLPGTHLTSVVVDDLEPGTWYFSAKAYRATGSESTFAAEVSTQVN